MISYKFNLYIEQGSDYSKEIILYDEYNNVINLTGYNVVATLKRSILSTTEILFNIEVINTINGKIKISLTNGTTTILEVGKYWFNLEIILISSQITTKLIIDSVATINYSVI